MQVARLGRRPAPRASVETSPSYPLSPPPLSPHESSAISPAPPATRSPAARVASHMSLGSLLHEVGRLDEAVDETCEEAPRRARPTSPPSAYHEMHPNSCRVGS